MKKASPKSPKSPGARPAPLRLISPNRENGIEWIGGRVQTSLEVAEERGFRPNLLVWIEEPSDLIVGSRLVEPRGADDDLGGLLLTTLEAPAVGAPRRPGTIRVGNERLAREVRAAVGESIPIRVGPTPEVEEAARSFEEFLGEDPSPTYLGEDPSLAEHFGELFTAARGLAEGRVWEIVGDHLFRLDIPALGVAGVCVGFMAGEDEEIGLLVFPSFDACVGFGEALPEGELEAATDLDFGTSWIGLTFGDDEEVPDSLLEEAREQGWGYAPGRFPILQSLARNGEPLALTETELRLACAAARVVLAVAALWEEMVRTGDDPVEEPTMRSFLSREGHEVHFAGPWEEFDFGTPGEDSSRD